ncbi:MAG: SurA N-terminal domain-containing protein [Bacteroidia bacterium]
MSDKYNKEEPSVIQKIQNQTGCLLLVIGIAMLAFVLTDLFSSRTSSFGNKANSIGSIDGESVDVQEYNQIYDALLNNVRAQNPGLELDERFLASYKQQAWNMLVQEKLVSQEYDALGLSVSGAEMEDITIGDNTHPQLVQAFTNQETGQFDKGRLVQYLREDIEASPDAKEQWLTFEKDMINQIVTEKYTALIRSAFYATELEARTAITREQLAVNGSIVGISFATIPDSTIQVTDRDLQKYIDAHRSEFKQEASRDIEFVAFDVKPSKEDSIATQEWINSNKEKFEKATDDSLFVSLMGSETPYDPAFKVRGNFTKDVEDDLFAADTNTVLGPYESNGTYGLFKVTEIGEDSLSSVRASHIMLSVAGRTKEDTLNAMSEARKLLADIRSGKTDFATEALTRNSDGTGDKGGDLGWMREKSRSAPEKFINQALKTSKGGYFVVATRNGVHLGKTTSNKSRRMIKVARLTQTVIPSTDTDREFYRMAGEFLAKAKGDEVFEEIAEGMGYTKKVAKEITEQERVVSGIQSGNIIARWLFDSETDEGDVSDIIEVDGKYLVAHCTKIRKEGVASIEDVRKDIEPKVLAQLKGEQLRTKVEEALKTSSTAEELADALDAVVTPVPNMTYEGGSIPYIGADDKVLGTLMGTAVGKHSDIIIGNNGIYVVYVNNHGPLEMPSDISDKRREITELLNAGTDSNVETSLLKIGKVKDRRYKFFN